MTFLYSIQHSEAHGFILLMTINVTKQHCMLIMNGRHCLMRNKTLKHISIYRTTFLIASPYNHLKCSYLIVTYRKILPYFFCPMSSFFLFQLRLYGGTYISLICSLTLIELLYSPQTILLKVKNGKSTNWQRFGNLLPRTGDFAIEEHNRLSPSGHDVQNFIY